MHEFEIVVRLIDWIAMVFPYVYVLYLFVLSLSLYLWDFANEFIQGRMSNAVLV